LTLLSNHAWICPRCSCQVPGILISEDSGHFISCLCCGYIVRDLGHSHVSYKELFDRYKPPQKQDNDYSDPMAKLLGLLVEEPDMEVVKDESFPKDS
jgi:Zn ribbon nucleic-acid-binding protein